LPTNPFVEGVRPQQMMRKSDVSARCLSEGEARIGIPWGLLGVEEVEEEGRWWK
jgi:hypothetical protein